MKIGRSWRRARESLQVMIETSTGDHIAQYRLMFLQIYRRNTDLLTRVTTQKNTNRGSHMALNVFVSRLE
jgi:hypothetical protein